MPDLTLPHNAGKILSQSRNHVLDDSKIAVYTLKHNSGKDAQNKCTEAEESYARQVLNWPHGRLAKPSIFQNTVIASDSIGACVEHFILHLERLVDEKSHEESSRELDVYPLVFVVFGDHHEDSPDRVTVVVALQSEDGDRWRLDTCRIALNVDLGQELDSLRMGDISTQDLISSYGNSTSH